jgi:glycosyltransferase involved in cell wall biosynthesis
MPKLTKSKKYILFTLDELQIGGVLTFIRQYIESLSDTGMQSIIIYASGNVENPEEIFPNSILISIGGKKYFQTGHFYSKVQFFFNYWKYLSLVLKKYPINIIHLSTPLSSFSTLLFWKTRKIKKIITFYGDYAQEQITMRNGRYSFLDHFKDKFRFFLQYFTLIFSQKIITFSEYSKDLIIKRFTKINESKIVLIQGTIIVFKNRMIERKRRSQKLRILNIGRFEIRKGIGNLLIAAKLLEQNGIPFSLTFAGPLDDYQYPIFYKQYEELNLFDKVHFIHKVNDQQRKMLIQKSDVFIIPSLDLETFGMTIIESMSFGLPVIGTPVGAIPEILSKIDPRLICRGTQPKDLLTTVLWFYQLSTAERNRLRNISLQAVKNFYRPNRMKKQLLQTYFGSSILEPSFH